MWSPLDATQLRARFSRHFPSVDATQLRARFSRHFPSVDATRLGARFSGHVRIVGLAYLGGGGLAAFCLVALLLFTPAAEVVKEVLSLPLQQLFDQPLPAVAGPAPAPVVAALVKPVPTPGAVVAPDDDVLPVLVATPIDVVAPLA